MKEASTEGTLWGPSVHPQYRHLRNLLISLLAWAVLCPTTSAAQPADSQREVWLEPAGCATWFTTRAPLDDASCRMLGVGFAWREGTARLAWRAHLVGGDDERVARFVYGDLVSLERVYVGDGVEWFWRVALGFGLDLRGEEVGLGTTGYFNGENGASGGLGLAHGWGFDLRAPDGVFVRGAADLRVYGAAGRTGVIGTIGLGVGRAW